MQNNMSFAVETTYDDSKFDDDGRVEPTEMQTNMSTFAVDRTYDDSKFDDDGRVKRTGTLTTATAHIITTVIGSGVLSLAWATAQLGWIAGTVALAAFSILTWFTSILLADCYRSPDSITGRRNYTYTEAVRANLGGRKVQLCGIAQYGALVGASIGYTITASISMVQIPNFHKLSLLSIIAAVMSFVYSSVGLGLSIAQIAGGAHPETSLTGLPVGKGMTGTEKMLQAFSALGDIAFAYAFSIILIDIQDTLKSSPPENKVMKKASSVAISITTIFYMLCGLVGYSAFGNNAPGNILTGFGFFEPFWLIDIANICIMIHLAGAFQVFVQPIYAYVKSWSKKKWRQSTFVTREYLIELPFFGIFSFNLLRLVWRTVYVIFTTVVAMIFPNFNDVVGLIGAIAFWLLNIFFPIEMYMAQAKISKYSLAWIRMQILSFACLIISVLAAAGSIHGLIKHIPTLKPFKSES